MWKRSDLKQRAKYSFKRNYWKSVLISLLLVLIAGGGGSSVSGVGANFTKNYQFNNSDNSYQDLQKNLMDQYMGESRNNSLGNDWRDYLDDDVLDYLNEYGYDDSYMDDYNDDYSDYYNGGYDDDLGNIDGFDSPFYGNSNEGDAFFSKAFFAGLAIVVVVAIIVFLIVMAIVILVDVFVCNPLEVGCKRYYLRNLNEPAQVGNVGFAFDHNYKNIMKTMFFRDLYTVLWTLLFIIPGIVKSYEYQMIPYLLADHPQMTREQAFAESKRMMKGQKWNAFVLDLSFIGWNILSALTLNILGIFYVQPYKDAAHAALYETLRYSNPYGAPYGMPNQFSGMPGNGFTNSAPNSIVGNIPQQ